MDTPTTSFFLLNLKQSYLIQYFLTFCLILCTLSGIFFQPKHTLCEIQIIPSKPSLQLLQSHHWTFFLHMCVRRTNKNVIYEFHWLFKLQSRSCQKCGYEGSESLSKGNWRGRWKKTRPSVWQKVALVPIDCFLTLVQLWKSGTPLWALVVKALLFCFTGDFFAEENLSVAVCFAKIENHRNGEIFVPRSAVVQLPSRNIEAGRKLWFLELSLFEPVHGISRVLRLIPDKLATALAINDENLPNHQDDGGFLIDLVLQLEKLYQKITAEKEMSNQNKPLIQGSHFELPICWNTYSADSWDYFDF